MVKVVFLLLLDSTIGLPFCTCTCSSSSCRWSRFSEVNNGNFIVNSSSDDCVWNWAGKDEFLSPLLGESLWKWSWGGCGADDDDGLIVDNIFDDSDDKEKCSSSRICEVSNISLGCFNDCGCGCGGEEELESLDLKLDGLWNWRYLYL